MIKCHVTIALHLDWIDCAQSIQSKFLAAKIDAENIMFFNSVIVKLLLYFNKCYTYSLINVNVNIIA